MSRRAEVIKWIVEDSSDDSGEESKSKEAGAMTAVVVPDSEDEADSKVKQATSSLQIRANGVFPTSQGLDVVLIDDGSENEGLEDNIAFESDNDDVCLENFRTGSLKESFEHPPKAKEVSFGKRTRLNDDWNCEREKVVDRGGNSFNNLFPHVAAAAAGSSAPNPSKKSRAAAAKPATVLITVDSGLSSQQMGTAVLLELQKTFNEKVIVETTRVRNSISFARACSSSSETSDPSKPIDYVRFNHAIVLVSLEILLRNADTNHELDRLICDARKGFKEDTHITLVCVGTYDASNKTGMWNVLRSFTRAYIVHKRSSRHFQRASQLFDFLCCCVKVIAREPRNIEVNGHVVSGGNTAKDLQSAYIQMIEQLPGLSMASATAIARVYPSLSHLIAHINDSSKSERDKIEQLSSISIPPKGTAVQTRALGVKTAKRLCDYLRCTDQNKLF